MSTVLFLYQCNGNSRLMVNVYSDGTTSASEVDVCQDSCKSGACVTDSTNGGRTAVDGSNSITGGDECSYDNQCASDERCDATGLCIPYQDNECSLDSDCSSGEVCEFGACFADTNECSVSADCGPGSYCDSGVCLADFSDNLNDTSDTYCTEDQYTACPSGGSILTAFCIDGEYKANTNVASCSSSSSSITGGVTSFIPSSDEGITRKVLLVAAGVLIIIAAVVGNNKLGPMGRNKRKIKKGRMMGLIPPMKKTHKR